MKSAGNLQGHGADADCLGGGDGPLAGGDGAADHNLARRIEIRGDEHFALGGFLAEFAGGGFIGSDQRHHAAGRCDRGLLHIVAPLGDQPQAFFESECSGKVQRGVFAEA